MFKYDMVENYEHVHDIVVSFFRHITFSFHLHGWVEKNPYLIAAVIYSISFFSTKKLTIQRLKCLLSIEGKLLNWFVLSFKYDMWAGERVIQLIWLHRSNVAYFKNGTQQNGPNWKHSVTHNSKSVYHIQKQIQNVNK